MKTSSPADVVTILEALHAEMELYLRTKMPVSDGRLMLWLVDVREALETAKERES